MKIGVIGSGMVSEALANGYLKHGHEVMRGTRAPAKLAAWRAQAGERAAVGSFAEAARFGEVIMLAVKGTAAESAVGLAGAENLAGKPVIDATNPLADAPPDQGVLRFFTDINESLMERLQRLAPAAQFVKAFSCVGSELMIDPKLPGALLRCSSAGTTAQPSSV